MWLHLEILLTGVAVVLGVLALLWGTAALLGLGFKLAERRHMAAAEPASSGQAGSPDPPRHHLALIVAAVANDDGAQADIGDIGERETAEDRGVQDPPLGLGPPII